MNNTILTTPLTVELTPESVSGMSLSKMLSKKEWDAIRRSVYEKYNYTCIHCKAVADRANVLWSYDEPTGIQTLTGIEAVCPECGLASHYQGAQTHEMKDSIHRHLMQVNGWTIEQVEEHVEKALAEYKQRSGVEWTMDASWLWTEYDISNASRARLLKAVRRPDMRLKANRMPKPEV